MTSSAMQALAKENPSAPPAHRAADLATRRRLLSHALASVIASKGQMHMPDEAVFEALTLPAMIASVVDDALDRTQREDVVRYIASLGAGMPGDRSGNGDIQELHDETCLALRPSLICMRWPGKTS